MDRPATVKTSSTPTLDTPLAALHASAGAKMGVWFGCALPDDFGDASAEYRYANQSVALVDKNYRAYLNFTGPDRARYLNAILTNDIKDLAAGQGTISLLLNPQGHILAELETYALADRHLCVSYAMIREQLIQWMEKYIIMDDVTLSDETERWGTLALEGPKAAAAAKELVGIDLAQLNELASVDGEILSDRAGTFGRFAPRQERGRQDDIEGMKKAPIPCRVVKRSPGGVAGAEFVAGRAQLPALWQILLEAARKHDGGPMGYTALSGQRLAQGAPWFGYDFGEKQIPHEAGLEKSHISYTKGCYTGQEIVERVRSRGHVNRRRVGLLFSGDTIAEPGAPLTTADGKEAGYVTRAARIWDPLRVIGIGYVRKEAEAPKTALQWAGGTATVILIPEGLKS
jgi:folate-binding protein YgfZ